MHLGKKSLATIFSVSVHQNFIFRVTTIAFTLYFPAKATRGSVLRSYILISYFIDDGEETCLDSGCTYLVGMPSSFPLWQNIDREVDICLRNSLKQKLLTRLLMNSFLSWYIWCQKAPYFHFEFFQMPKVSQKR